MPTNVLAQERSSDRDQRMSYQICYAVFPTKANGKKPLSVIELHWYSQLQTLSLVKTHPNMKDQVKVKPSE